MTTATIQANRLILDKRNTLVYDGKGWVVLGAFSNGELEEALLNFAGNMVQVQFRTYSLDTAAQDMKTYSRRLSKLSPRFVFGGWTNQIIDGHIFDNVFVGTLNRCF